MARAKRGAAKAAGNPEAAEVPTPATPVPAPRADPSKRPRGVLLERLERAAFAVSGTSGGDDGEYAGSEAIEMHTPGFAVSPAIAALLAPRALPASPGDGAWWTPMILEHGAKVALETAISEPFRRARPREKSAAGNLGLGLYIAHQIVLSHVGTLSAHSEHGTTTFTVRLPRAATG